VTDAPTQHLRPQIDQILPPRLAVPTVLERLAFTTAGRVRRGGFWADLLLLWGVERVRRDGRWVVHPHDWLSGMSWAQAEGDAGRLNLLNCTQHEPGSTRFNSVDVQNYASKKTSLHAHARTLNFGAEHDEHGYDAIRDALRNHAKPSVVARAVEASAWGTGGLMLRVYEETPDSVLLGYRHHPLVQ
jgi:hypothetical protein